MWSISLKSVYQALCLNSKKYLSLYRIPVKLRSTCQGSVLQANYAPRCQYPQCHIIRPDIGASDGRGTQPSFWSSGQGTGGGDGGEDEEPLLCWCSGMSCGCPPMRRSIWTSAMRLWPPGPLAENIVWQAILQKITKNSWCLYRK